ncbi:MAG: NAD(P)/FAD-dependent oxidoreductase, partial [Actinobacteria bacterium]|nr:NAD(P)/FAD-dependent oxidoreductase [Actinomycetota bacterium]
GFADKEIWREVFEQPIGISVANRFADDVVRGVVLTDALVGTFASTGDMQANICFLYHIIGNGTGEWRVPEGGMGAVAADLERAARTFGVEISINSRVAKIDGDNDGIEITTTEGVRKTCRELVWCADDRSLSRLLGSPPRARLDGAQIKMNMLLRELPRLKSGIDPKVAFAGTFHIDESAIQLESAFQLARAGTLPQVIPAEVYCHSLTDPKIVGDAELHTLTLFAFHTPAELFEKDRALTTAKATERIINGINSYLESPIEEVLAYDSDGRACLEVKTPLDLEDEIDLPRGNIFHADLTMPFVTAGITDKWGSATEYSNIHLGGASAVRGGGVSGIAGHNAAFAILQAS